MKRIYIILIVLILMLQLAPTVRAADGYTERLFGFFDSATEGLMESFGVYQENGEAVWDISPARALEAVKKLFTEGIGRHIGNAAVCVTLVAVTALISALMNDTTGIFMMSKAVALMSVMYLTVSFTGEIFSECCSALLVTKDFMLVLIPVFGGAVTATGNPSLALSFNSVVFAFAEAVAIAFEGIVPSLSSLLTCIYCANAINPFMRLDSLCRVILKAVSLFMAFTAGIFVAVLSIRGVISGAADSVTIRGLRFLIGNSVPVVGSAIGEALNSVVAGLGLIKNTVGMLGIVGVIAINLPALINILVWKGMLYVVSVTADIADCSEIKGFTCDLSGVLSLITGAVCFVSFVFIISIAIIITISRS